MKSLGDKELVRMVFGSRLYGTNTPTSDTDYKAVHISDPRKILMQEVTMVKNVQTKVGGKCVKNTASDFDMESYELIKFIRLLTQGQTNAIDMVFAPKNFWEKSSPAWERIVANRNMFLTKKAQSFVGYCRAQANKYGAKGSRVAAARWAMDYFKPLADKNPNLLVSDVAHGFGVLPEYVKIIDLPSAGGPITHLDVCNKKAAYTVTVKLAYEIYERLFNEYGHRAFEAETNQGVDWKALSHAVRIAEEAIELFDFGNVEFPRPNADYLRSIKLGERPYKEVAETIDGLLSIVEDAAANSSLPENVDSDAVYDFLTEYYGGVMSRYIKEKELETLENHFFLY